MAGAVNNSPVNKEIHLQYPLDCILIQITNFICPYQNPVCLYTESSLNEVKMCEGQADEGGGQQSSDSSTCDDKMFFFFFS